MVPCGFASPTGTMAGNVLVLQAALLLVPAAVPPPAVCPSGSTAEHRSVLTWHKSDVAVY